MPNMVVDSESLICEMIAALAAVYPSHQLIYNLTEYITAF